MEKLNPVTVIPHSESTIDEEVEFTTFTQYVISGSTLDISRVKGAVQVREMSASTRSTDGDPTAVSSPANVLINICIKISFHDISQVRYTQVAPYLLRHSSMISQDNPQM